MSQDALLIIPQKLAQSIPAIGLRFEKETLIVGLPASFNDSDIDKALDTLVDVLGISLEAQQIEDTLLNETIDAAYNGKAAGHFTAPASLNTRSEGPIIDLVNRILEAALKMRASDIHIEPMEKELLIRVRIDGMLENLTTLSLSFAPAIVSRLKVLAKLSIVERRRPQDGQFTFETEGHVIDVRLATVATLYGEKAALRLLDTHRNIGGLPSLGMPEDKLSQLTRILKSRSGLIIASGPTGSGKTTTMHGALELVNSPEKNISTIEDPVEYVIDGVNHIPVNEGVGASFTVQLRAILRQDPDIILLGEIRDAETARIAVQAALSGRLVLSTLHAPDAIGSIYRLYQMGIEPYMVAASLISVVSQRLFRRNCQYCTVESNITPSLKAKIQASSGAKKLNLQEGIGCSICRNTGYFERIGAYQLLEITETMRELISQRPTPRQLEALAKSEGLKPLQGEALLLAAAGITSTKEVMEFEIDYE